MKTPEEIKNGLDALKTCHDLMTFNPMSGEEIDPTLMNADNRELYYGIETIITYIQQHESNWQQVSKALCGKENATLEEVLQVINQVTPCTFAIPPRSGKTLAAQRIAKLEQELSAVKRERDAAVFALHGNCDECCWKDTAKCASCVYSIDAWNTQDDCWEWDGVCPDTEVQPNE